MSSPTSNHGKGGAIGAESAAFSGTRRSGPSESDHRFARYNLHPLMSLAPILDLHVVELKTHADERGFFREILRLKSIDPAFGIAQLSHSLVHTGVTKGWHGHHRFSQLTYFATGAAIVVFVDQRPDSPSFGKSVEKLVSDALQPLVTIHPPGVVLAYRCTQGPAHVFYATTGVFDLHEEIRIDLEGGIINYDWQKWTVAR